jgi:hypothetical protein
MIEKFLKYMFLGAVVVFSSLQANCERVGQCPQFDKFARRFSLAQAGEIGRSIIECQAQPRCNGALKNTYAGQVRGFLSNVWLKGTEIERVINAHRMQNCIEKNNLYLLGVAQKCVGMVDGQWKVFAENIVVPGGKHITLELVKQLIVLAEETGFRDWNSNWVWNTSGKLICIDTEDNSFLIGRHRGVKGMEISAHCKFNYVASLNIWANSMDEEAREWFQTRINELLNSVEGLQEDKPLPFNTKYDDPNAGIDFQKVKEEYQAYNNHEDGE